MRLVMVRARGGEEVSAERMIAVMLNFNFEFLRARSLRI
jgi:hypothetical protein